MGMNMTEKIFARHAGLDKVVPGQLIKCKLDLVLGNDITSPPAITEFNKIGIKEKHHEFYVSTAKNQPARCGRDCRYG